MARAAFQADQPITPCSTTRGLRELICGPQQSTRSACSSMPSPSFQRSMTRSSLGSLQRNRDAPSRTPCPQREGRNVALSPATTMRTPPPPHTQRSAPLLRAGRLAARNDTTQPITGTSSTFIPIFLLLVAPDAAETGLGRAAIAELITPRDATGFKQDYYAVKSHYVPPPPLLDCAAAKEGKGMAAKSDTAVRGTAARADCGSRDGAAGRARRYAREREDACVGEAAFEGEAARIGEEGGAYDGGGGTCTAVPK